MLMTCFAADSDLTPYSAFFSGYSDLRCVTFMRLGNNLIDHDTVPGLN
jgi:hypothetical protein